MNRRARLIPLIVLLGSWLGAATTRVYAAGLSDLVELLPTETIAYYGWGGADQLSAVSEGSPLGVLLNDPDFVRLSGTVTSELELAIRRQAANDSGPTKYVVNQLSEVAKQAWRMPCVVALLGLSGEGNESIQAALLIQTTDKTGALKLATEQLTATLIRGAHESRGLSAGGFEISSIDSIDGLRGGQCVKGLFPAGPVSWGFVGDVFVVTLGSKAPALVARSIGGNGRIADSAVFAAARPAAAMAGATPALGLFVNMEQLRAQIASSDDGAGSAIVMNLVETQIGSAGMRSVVAESQITPAGMRHVLSLAATDTKSRMLEFISARAIGDDELVVAPAHSAFMFAGRFEFGDAVASDEMADGTGGAAISLALWQFLKSQSTGSVVAFHSPQDGEWMTLCIRVRSTTRAMRGLRELLGKLHRDERGQPLPVKTAKFDRHEIIYLDTPAVFPTFAPAAGVSGNWLVIAPFPQMAATTLDRLAGADARSRSILANPEFAAAHQKWTLAASAVSWQDGGAYVEALYPMLLSMGQGLIKPLGGSAKSFDVSLLPRQSTLSRVAGKSLSWIQRDAHGIRMESLGSVPLLTPSIPEAVVLSPMIVAAAQWFVEPEVPHADRLESHDRLRQVAMSCQQFAVDHDGKLPAKPSELRSYLRAEIANWIELGDGESKAPRACMFVSDLPNLRDIKDPSSFVLVYENPAVYGGKGTNVVYADGSVRWCPTQVFQSELEQTKLTIAELATPASDEKP